MRRYPNPWVFGPAALGLIIGAWLGYFIAELSGTGTLGAFVIATISGFSAAIGVGIVSVLAIRSFAEWRIAEEQGVPAPGVGCEVPEPD